MQARLDAASDDDAARQGRVASWNKQIEKGCNDKAGKHWVICGVGTSNWKDVLKYVDISRGAWQNNFAKNWSDIATANIAKAHGLTAPKNPVLVLIAPGTNGAAHWSKSILLLVCNSALIAGAMLLAYRADMSESAAYESLETGSH